MPPIVCWTVYPLKCKMSEIFDYSERCVTWLLNQRIAIHEFSHIHLLLRRLCLYLIGVLYYMTPLAPHLDITKCQLNHYGTSSCSSLFVCLLLPSTVYCLKKRGLEIASRVLLWMSIMSCFSNIVTCQSFLCNCSTIRQV